MEWAEAISEAVRFIERHITEDITLYDSNQKRSPDTPT